MTPISSPLQTFSTESEASDAKGVLEAFDIDCNIARDDCGVQRPHMAQSGGIRLIVKAGDTERANDVLRTNERSTIADF
jgi:hypothetical protein